MYKDILLVLLMVAVMDIFFSVARAGLLYMRDLVAAFCVHVSAACKQSESVNLAEALLGGKGA